MEVTNPLVLNLSLTLLQSLHLYLEKRQKKKINEKTERRDYGRTQKLHIKSDYE